MSADLPADENDKKLQSPLETPLLSYNSNHSHNNNNNNNATFEFSDKMLDEENFEEVYRRYPLTDDTMCGIGALRGRFIQKLANKKVYVFFYGLAGSVFGATYAYFNGTITTIEKRYKIPSQNTGIISVGNDISSLFVSAILAYYAGKGHRPRWLAFGLFAIVLYCILTTLPHFLYGPGQQALSLTKEYGAYENDSATLEILEKQRKKMLCNLNAEGVAECDTGEDNWMPQVLLFSGQLVAGIGQSLFYTIGVAYMDDNIKKSKTPALISFSYFLRLLGPAGGYALASFCLKIYISPDLHPTINNNDPRWLGAWWLGWLVLACCLFGFAFFMCMFPKELPRAALRRRIASERRKRGMKTIDGNNEDQDEIPASFNDMIITFKRLLKNATFMLNNIAAIFYYFGYMPYWIFTPKYIETQYKQSASVSSFVTGTVALVFSAIGVLSSGIVISKYKPKARYLAFWNVFVGSLSVIGMVAYMFLGCAENENSVVFNTPLPGSSITTCNSDCHCDFVKYSPVCGADNKIYISPCHAGCKSSSKVNGTKIYADCACINGTFDDDFAEFTLPPSVEEVEDEKLTTTFETITNFISGGSAKDGSCSINCQKEFFMFLAVMCFLKFSGATGRASNFLVGVRCVEERDKTVAMGFGMAFMCLFSFMPSPIFFGTLMDMTCLVWGKTCSGTGNCWLYDTEKLRYWLNLIAAGFVSLGVIFDVAVWYCVKDLKIFDEEIKDKEIDTADKEDEMQFENPKN